MQVVSRRLFNDQCPTGHLQDRPNAGHAPDPLSPPCLGPTRPRRGRKSASVADALQLSRFAAVAHSAGAIPIRSPHPDRSVPALPPALWPASPPSHPPPASSQLVVLHLHHGTDGASARAGRRGRHGVAAERRRRETTGRDGEGRRRRHEGGQSSDRFGVHCHR